MADHSEYQVEFCGLRGDSIAKGNVKKGSNTAGPVLCSKTEDVQPVGGRCQARARAEAMAAATRKSGRGLPVYDANHVATVYSEADRGTHRVQPQWKDPRWSEEMRAQTSTLYSPAGRDPPNRNNFYVYQTTRVDPLHTPAQPLPVPDVHKLRYMHNNYMTQDDWY